MDSNKIKNLATGAREALRAEVNARLDAVLAPDSAERLDNPNGAHLIEAAISDRGRDHVVDQAAYTWFNRLCALRYMDARGYTPVPVVTPRKGSTQPAVLADAIQGVFDPEYQMSRLARDRVSSLLMGTTPSDNATEAAYAQLISAVCAHYAEPMPYLFKEEVASSLLMPQGLLSESSILQRIVEDMDDNNCASVEVLGWLYQYYIAEKKDEIFASNKKRGADEIGPATQLFTPNWIVRYMAENSLGRIWMLNNPSSGLCDAMEYYIEGETPDEYLKVYSASELKVLDPACGSGHILVYCFDLLFAMYEEEGWQPEDIPAMILQNNLYGFEIDGRAGEIAKFALEMKAREKDPQFFDRHIDVMVTVLEPVRFSEDELNEAWLLAGNTPLLEAFNHLDEIGSLYVPELSDEVFINNAIENLERSSGMFAEKTIDKLNKMLEQVQKLSQKFSAVVANPPYMGYRLFNPWLFDWTKANYPSTYFDLCACFIERGLSFIKEEGFLAEVTMHTWATEKSFKRIRRTIFDIHSVVSMMHMGSSVMPIAFDTSATVFSFTPHLSGVYFKVDSSMLNETRLIPREKFHSLTRYIHGSESFAAIPDGIIAYTLSDNLCSCFDTFQPASNLLSPRVGIQTGDTPRFVRDWWEVASQKTLQIGLLISDAEQESRMIQDVKWIPYKNGGDYRKWYGNASSVIMWENDGFEVIDCAKDENRKVMSLPKDVRLKPMVSWGEYGYGRPTFRYSPKGYLFDVIEPAFVDADGYLEKNLFQLQAFFNSTVAGAFIDALMPGRHKNVGKIGALPFDVGTSGTLIADVASSNTALARLDWDAFETSWDFEQHPLAPLRLGSTSLISDDFARWSDECQQRFDTLKANEEELNRIFAEIYHMEGEVPIEVPDDKVSVRRADLQRDIKSLISYGVGCLFGRYSVDKPGLILADQGSTAEDFREKVPNASFGIDEDGILPVLDGEWFADDITAQFKRWLEVVYGADTLSENIAFIKEALGKDIRTYFVKDFYNDHVKIYQKRPIYWLFSSPKKSFSALIYLHRYTPSTVGQILTGYLREYIEKLNSATTSLDVSDRAADRRQADKYRIVVKELSEWERDVIYPLANEHIEIDLDDGVKVNYNKFPNALRKVPDLSDWR